MIINVTVEMAFDSTKKTVSADQRKSILDVLNRSFLVLAPLILPSMNEWDIRNTILKVLISNKELIKLKLSKDHSNVFLYNSLNEITGKIIIVRKLYGKPRIYIRFLSEVESLELKQM